MSVYVLHVVMVMLILMCGPISSHPLEAKGRSRRVRRECFQSLECPAGQYLSSCDKCSECPPWHYTSQKNTDRLCNTCFRNCNEEFNMQVVKACTSVSDVVCRCMDGFMCSGTDKITNQCISCLPISTSQSTSASTATTATTATLRDPKTDVSHQIPPAAMVFSYILVIISIVLGAFLCLCRRRKKECLKNWVKQCSHSNQKCNVATTTSQASEPTRQTQAEKVESHPSTPISNTPDCPVPQPASTEQPVPPHGNLGPLHIYGAGTVFVSLLNQFGQNGREKDEGHLQQGSESEHQSPTSPPLPLSTEENNIFFPSQEQGKECHMSKEEGL